MHKQDSAVNNLQWPWPTDKYGPIYHIYRLIFNRLIEIETKNNQQIDYLGN